MDFSAIPLFNIMKTKLGYLSARQSVLAQNVANADTPDYKAQDLTAPDFGRMVRDSNPVRNLQMKTTNPRHITGRSSTGSAYKVTERDKTAELNPNGNNVVIEEEMAKIGENQAEYAKVLNLYAKAVAMFKSAIGNPGGGG